MSPSKTVHEYNIDPHTRKNQLNVEVYIPNLNEGVRHIDWYDKVIDFWELLWFAFVIDNHFRTQNHLCDSFTQALR
jgi:hypothetical protein